MCMICIELDKERLTSQEAFSNLREVIQDLDQSHIDEILGKIGKQIIIEHFGKEVYEGKNETQRKTTTT